MFQEKQSPAPRDVVRLVAIREQALSVDEVLHAVDHDGAGGVTLFVGRVRNHDQENLVDALDYSAHPRALEAMQAVCAAVASRHAVCALAAVHAVGYLSLGDVAVVVAASSSHRAEAFAAARDLIDTLKAEVPIWKHQMFADGTEEWVGCP
ncbi:molybdenum cofactor biosynthesis protein MoaE [Nocardioides sp. JQ2195]|uniref:molybdenum cofactor biosynthesis protein MoaE n=1 Tax=Nocardioides sp. JQ2195 TaxID=2592334 RepID=UPI00143E65F2|nr:molybdenum cofactor biosynthesis protein MoaE [Nocardioides sp. JQ2195]QIX26968.1 molybdenum cofactor biosynthesis protein MoaE [Nocardioides sp. JQ2195]